MTIFGTHSFWKIVATNNNYVSWLRNSRSLSPCSQSPSNPIEFKVWSWKKGPKIRRIFMNFATLTVKKYKIKTFFFREIFTKLFLDIKSCYVADILIFPCLNAFVKEENDIFNICGFQERQKPSCNKTRPKIIFPPTLLCFKSLFQRTILLANYVENLCPVLGGGVRHSV